MTISEASAVNTVLRALGMRSPNDLGPPTVEEIAEAATVLAKNAYKAIYAGLTPDDVAAWAKTVPRGPKPSRRRRARR